jgi:hypothetical protein
MALQKNTLYPSAAGTSAATTPKAREINETFFRLAMYSKRQQYIPSPHPEIINNEAMIAAAVKPKKLETLSDKKVPRNPSAVARTPPAPYLASFLS